jgi:hypothetical protein
MRVGSDRGYGWSIFIHPICLTLIINGHIFSIYRGLNSGKWHAEYIQNVWRRQGVPIRG